MDRPFDPNIDSSFGPIAPALQMAYKVRCDSCGQLADPETKRIRHKITVPRPTDQQLREWVCDSVAEATDGCEIEPDGTCEHGHKSWLLVYGMI